MTMNVPVNVCSKYVVMKSYAVALHAQKGHIAANKIMKLHM
jgi:hypothetical protein